MNRKRTLIWVLGVISVSLVTVTGLALHELANTNVLNLRLCMTEARQPFPWLCEQFFYRYHPTPEEVKELNTTAGARLALYETRDESEARRLLKHMIDAGVDINAVDEGTITRSQLKQTALHGAVLRPAVMEVKVLLEFGASREVRDAKGRTPLELARELQAKNPDPQREEVIHLLEAGKS